MEQPSTSNPTLANAIRSSVLKVYSQPHNGQEIEEKINRFLTELAVAYEKPIMQEVIHSRKAGTPNANAKVSDIFMTMLVGCAGVEVANIILNSVALLQNRVWGSRNLDLKRPRENGDEGVGVEGSRKRKRVHFLHDQVLWADYACDDESDSSYTPSTEDSEDDDAHMTQEDLHEIRDYAKGWTTYEDLRDITGDLSSGEETELDSDNSTTMRWKDCPDYPDEEESESNDPDYVPPAWNFEDVLELVSATDLRDCRMYYEDLDELCYINELRERGPMSDGGISSDSDNSAGEQLHDIFTISRTLGMYDVPQHLKKYNSLPAYFRAPFNRAKTHEPFLDLRKQDLRWYKFYARKLCDDGKLRQAREINDRLDRLLAVDPLPYAFDDEEWKGFEDPRRSHIAGD